MTTFIQLGVEPDITRALETRDITRPFPIQEETIPLALTGQDIIGQAKTGTGKTFGFGLPMIQRLGLDPAPEVAALVVVPTRELCVQVTEDMELATSLRSTKVTAIYGGKSYEEQIQQLKAGAQIVVGTPGRLLDLVSRRQLSLSAVREVVLDEADKMLDLGFLPDIERLFAELPERRHTMLFSATMPGQILALARRFMSRPVHIRSSDPDEGPAQANIQHIVYRVHALDKNEMVARILQADGRGKTIIFTRTKRAAASLMEELSDRGFPAVAVHGDLNQDQRERAMARFKSGKRDVLIATDVAARGIDVDDVTHVINHTVPDDEETYLHRVGRTGRAGKTGIAVTFVDWDDLHKWALTNRALDMGQPEPAETYSSSPHLYSELNIPEGTKGRIGQPQAPRSRSAGHPGADRGTRNNGNRTDGDRSPRKRRRTRSGNAAAGAAAPDASAASTRASAASEAASTQAAPGAGTHDGGGAEHHDGNAPAIRRRRRRRLNS